MPKVQRLRQWRFTEPVFGMPTYLLHGSGAQVQRWADARFPPADLGNMDVSGKAMLVVRQGGEAVLIWLPETWNIKHSTCLGTLAHECSHAAWYTLMHRGVKLSEQAEEAFTYYIGYLMRECHKRLGR